MVCFMDHLLIRKKGKEHMKDLDLRKDFDAIYAFVAERVTSFDPSTNKGPGDPGPIARIDFGFGFDQDGWVSLVFDTRLDAEPDGEWNGYIEGNDLQRPLWFKACEANEEAPLALVLPDGTKRKLPPGSSEELGTALGEMLRGVLLKARDDGVFASLPKAAKCELGVEEQNGMFGWPAYESRGTDNLA
jgi:hypothetical protein